MVALDTGQPPRAYYLLGFTNAWGKLDFSEKLIFSQIILMFVNDKIN